jgi:hypothetical protein
MSPKVTAERTDVAREKRRTVPLRAIKSVCGNPDGRIRTTAGRNQKVRRRPRPPPRIPKTKLSVRS